VWGGTREEATEKVMAFFESSHFQVRERRGVREGGREGGKKDGKQRASPLSLSDEKWGERRKWINGRLKRQHLSFLWSIHYRRSCPPSPEHTKSCWI